MLENWTTETATEYLESPIAITHANDIFHAAQEGFISPLDAYLKLKELADLAKLLQDEIKESAVSEAQKWDEKKFTYNGFVIEKRAGAGTWKFDHIPLWKTKKEDLKAKEESCKSAFKMWEKGQIVCDEFGEVIQPATYTPGGDVIAISRPKKETEI